MRYAILRMSTGDQTHSYVTLGAKASFLYVKGIAQKGQSFEIYNRNNSEMEMKYSFTGSVVLQYSVLLTLWSEKQEIILIEIMF